MSKVSILLSSYNHANYLKKSIDSILNQTYNDFELIIVDDCSSDDSWKIIKSYKDKRIRKIRHKENKGSILTIELVESFNGEYFAVAHCDDYWEKTKLEKQVKFLEEHHEIAACFTYVKLVDENDSEDLITLNSIYKIDNLGDLLVKNNEITILNSYARLYKKAIDYIVINLSISDNRELTLLLEELDRKLNYFLVFKVNYDDFIEVFKLKLNEVNYTRKLTIKGE